MKRSLMLLLVLLLCVTGALAVGENSAALWRDAVLFAAPLEGAQELMRYHAGTRVEVVREVDHEYVYVIVGTQGGSQMGYMEKQFLYFGEERIRRIYPGRNVYPQHGWTLYSYCDVRSEVISNNNDTYIYAIGENDEWIHALVTSGSRQWTGFVSKAESGLTDDMATLESVSWIYTEPLEGELAIAEAIEYAKEIILKAETMANGQSSMPVTMEMLDNCWVNVDVQWDIDAYYAGVVPEKKNRAYECVETTTPLSYAVTFFYSDKTWEDGFPMICALAVLHVEGDQVVSYHFGRG